MQVRSRPLIMPSSNQETVVVSLRLRKHRGRLSSTLSSNGSGFNARKFMKLFFMSIFIIILYTPVTLAFLYFNLPLPLIPYSWSRVHNPETWDPILYFTTAQFNRLQYYGWTPVVTGGFIFAYYGMNNEAIDMYRKFVGKWMGLGKIWPSLLQPREVQRRNNSSRASWAARLDLVGKAIHYFDGVRKNSQATSTIGASSEA